MATPCEDVINEPKPPVTMAIPIWEGRILNSSLAIGIVGATIRLFQCRDNMPVEVDTTRTDSFGTYKFGYGLFDPGFYYFVQVDMTGPMSGLSLSSGTSNPTDALPVGPSQTEINLTFE